MPKTAKKGLNKITVKDMRKEMRHCVDGCVLLFPTQLAVNPAPDAMKARPTHFEEEVKV